MFVVIWFSFLAIRLRWLQVVIVINSFPLITYRPSTRCSKDICYSFESPIR